MLDKARSKIKTEMDNSKDKTYIQVIGGFLLQYLNINPSAAESILNKDKTIEKSLNEMRKAAEKKKVGNSAVLTDQEGFVIVLKHFGIDGNVGNLTSAAAPVASTPKKTEIDFDVKLEDLL